MTRSKTALGALTGLGVAGFTALSALVPAHAVPVTITITNNQAENGLHLTPLYVAFHNGLFDAFQIGGIASAGVEELAELGSVGTLAAERLAVDPGSTGVVLGAPGGFPGAPIIEPGETATITVDVDPTSQRFVQFLSMILPSNDTFIGLDDAVALFDEDGVFLGQQIFEITNAFAYDAGTEVNDLTDGPAFVSGADAMAGAIEGGVITQSLGLGAIAGIELPNGQLLSPALAAAFFGGQSSLATITFDSAAVPLPGALLLFGSAIAGAAGVRRRKLAAAPAA